MRRVAITGYGVTSCLGNTRDEVLAALRDGRSGIVFLPERKEMGFRSALAGKLVEPTDLPVARRTLRLMGPAARMAIHAASEAVEHAQLPEEELKSDRTAVVIGHCGVLGDAYKQLKAFHLDKRTLPGSSLQRMMNDTVSANLSTVMGSRGSSYTVSSACATGAVAIGQAFQLIQRGLQDRALCGGFMEDSWESACHLDALKALSVREDEPEKASRPFDARRDGIVPSAGGSILVLEEWDAAVARGATIRAELLGYAFANDGHDRIQPSGEGGRRALRQALAEGGVDPGEVDYVNAHASSTPEGDAVEARALAEVLGERPLVSSTKSMTGHEGGAAGSNELVYTLLMMQESFVAPSINLEEPDPACSGIRIAANERVDEDIAVAVSTVFGFGGVNSALALRKST